MCFHTNSHDLLFFLLASSLLGVSADALGIALITETAYHKGNMEHLHPVHWYPFRLKTQLSFGRFGLLSTHKLSSGINSTTFENAPQSLTFLKCINFSLSVGRCLDSKHRSFKELLTSRWPNA